MTRLQPIKIENKLKSDIEKFESFASEGDGLLRILIPHAERLRLFENLLRQATIFWSLSSVLQEMIAHPDILNKFRPFSSAEHKKIAFLFQAEAFTSSSIVFRTWVSLVYSRYDKLKAELEQIEKLSKDNHFTAAMQLLKNNEVRLIRNAIAHGGFSAFAMELEYEVPQGKEMVKHTISYNQLDRLNFCIYGIILAIWSASLVPSNSTNLGNETGK